MEGLEELGSSGKGGQKKGFTEPYREIRVLKMSDLSAWGSLVTAL